MRLRFPAFALVLVLGVALTACGGNKSSNANNGNGNAMNGNGMNGAAMARVPNCGAVKAVWVNLNSKVYHEPGDPYYGHTRHGEYLCPSQAKEQGFRPAGGAAMMNQEETTTRRHHRRHPAGAMEQSTP